jgi:phosphoenolpyruvate carboxykinase (ATP)
MSLPYTRRMVRAALAGELDGVPLRGDPLFQLEVPRQVGGVPPELLDPRATWSDPAAYDRRAAELADRFVQNFQQFEGEVDGEVRAAGPRVGAKA